MAILLPVLTQKMENEPYEFIVLLRLPGRVVKVPINFFYLLMIMYKRNELKNDLFDFKEEFRGNISTPTPVCVISHGKGRMSGG